VSLKCVVSEAFRRVLLLAAALGLLAVANPLQAAVAFVQGNSAVATSGSPVSATYPSAQAAGDLNVIFVGWDQATSHVQSVTDTNGNTYVAAIGPTVVAIGPTANPSGATQVTYYAKNIAASAAGTNIVTVTFTAAVSYPDVRILEFSGVSTSNPLDVVSGAIGTGTTLNSGALTTTASNDLLVASGYGQNTENSGAGSGYTQILRSSWNPVEDAILTAAGSYSATSTMPSGYWVMQQVAFRAANLGADTSAPTAPGVLTATAVSSTQVNLNWAPATDNVSVTGYLVERCLGVGCSNFAQIGSSGTAMTYQDTGLSSLTSYTYRIRASDGAGNLSGYSLAATDTTLVGNATYAQGNSTTATSANSVSTTYTSAQKAGDLNVVFVGWYQATSSVQSINDSNGNVYVAAVGPTVNPSGLTQIAYYASNIAPAAAGTNTITVTFANSVSYPDVRILEFSGILPASPFDAASAAIGTGATLNSGPISTSTPNELLVASGDVQHTYTGGAGPGYTQILVSSWNLVEDAVVTATGSYSATSSTSSGYWVMQQLAFKAAVDDNGSPSAPASLSASASSSSQVNLSWPASTDDVGVAGYRVERCQGAGCTNFEEIATPTTATYIDVGLAAATSYTYRVRARDAVGNLSPYSPIATTSTQSVGGGYDTTPPSAPALLKAATVTSGQIDLSWTASNDDVGVTSYLVESCSGTNCTIFSQIGTSASVNFRATELAPSISYSFRIRATDGAGNLSDYSNTVTMVTTVVGTICD
jgi:Fibronectin type III domain